MIESSQVWTPIGTDASDALSVCGSPIEEHLILGFFQRFGNAEARNHLYPKVKYWLKFKLDGEPGEWFGDEIVLALQPRHPAFPRRIPDAMACIANTMAFIECDGREYHSDPSAFISDRAKDREALALGFIPIRFGGYEINRNAIGCAEEIVRIVDRWASVENDLETTGYIKGLWEPVPQIGARQ